MLQAERLRRLGHRSAAVLAALVGSVGLAQGQLELAKLVPSGASSSQHFGDAVAIRGDHALVGARYTDSGGASNSGAAYAYRRDGKSWLEVQVLVPAVSAPSDSFGTAVALGDDVAFVGAPYADGAFQDSGAVVVFRWDGSAWIEDSVLTAEPGDQATGAHFGSSLAVFGDVLLVGAPEDDLEGDDVGTAHVFRRLTEGWVHEQRLRAGDGASFDHFGASVALGPDTALVGASQFHVGPGAVHAFLRSGSSWVEVQELAASDGRPGDLFGGALSLSGDDLLVGAPDDKVTLVRQGSAYAFRWEGTSWSEVQKLLEPDGFAYENFGAAVALDGDLTVVGAPGAGVVGFRPGAIFTFEKEGTSWVRRQTLIASDSAHADSLGSAVAASGGTVLVGAPRAVVGSTSSGAAYLFRDFLLEMPLAQSLSQVSLAAGGTQTFSVWGGLDNASGLFWLLGSNAGAGPGIALPGYPINLPLTFSSYLAYSFAKPNTVIQPSLDFLDPTGRATAVMTVPPGATPSLAGVTYTHAFLVADPVTLKTTLVSNPVGMTFLP